MFVTDEKFGDLEPFEDDKEWFASQAEGQDDAKATKAAIILICVIVFVLLLFCALCICACCICKRARDKESTKV